MPGGWSCRAAGALQRSLGRGACSGQISLQQDRHVLAIHSAIHSKIGRAGSSVPTRSLGHDLGHDGPLGTLRWIIGGHRDRKRQRHRGSRGAAGVLVLAVPSMEDPECRGAETPNARESVSKERAAEQAGGAMILTGLPDGWMGQQGTGGAALLEAGQPGPPLLPCRFGH